MNKTLILARLDEDTKWVTNLEGFSVRIIQKGIDLPNIGREPSSYVKFIIDNYDNLNGLYVFAQANPFDHSKNFISIIKSFSDDTVFKCIGDSWYECDTKGFPQHYPLRVGEVYEYLFEEPSPQKFLFTAGCMFVVNSNTIKKYSLQFWKKIFKILVEEELFHKSPWIMERIFPILFKRLE